MQDIQITRKNYIKTHLTSLIHNETLEHKPNGGVYSTSFTTRATHRNKNTLITPTHTHKEQDETKDKMMNEQQ